MDPEVQQFLVDLYQPLIGHVFEAKYNGEFEMREKNSERSILVITPQNAFAAELQRISSDVLARDDGQRIWRGITRPEDRPDFVNYWLWVEPGIRLSLQKGSIRSFKISHCKPFPCDGPRFTHGVSIKVELE